MSGSSSFEQVQHKFAHYEEAIAKCRKIGCVPTRHKYRDEDHFVAAITKIHIAKFSSPTSSALWSSIAEELHGDVFELWITCIRGNIERFERRLKEYEKYVQKNLEKFESLNDSHDKELYSKLLESQKNKFQLLSTTPVVPSDYIVDDWNQSFNDLKKINSELFDAVATMSRDIVAAKKEIRDGRKRWGDNLRLGLAFSGGGGGVGIIGIIIANWDKIEPILKAGLGLG